MEEVWKDIPEFEGYYQVSDLGRIRSLDRVVNCKSAGKRFAKGRVLKDSKRSDGYRHIALWRGWQKKVFLIHRLVAQAFLLNPENKSQVNHKHGNKIDNRASELEWNTHKENTEHAVQSGLIPSTSSPQSLAIVQLSLDQKVLNIWPSAKEVQRRFGYDCSSIAKCAKGKSKTAYGFKWEYANRKSEKFSEYLS